MGKIIYMRENMKKFFKIIVCLLIVPCMFLFVGCEDNKYDDFRIASIVQVSYDDTHAEYLITYKNGETLTFSVPVNNVVSISSIQKTSSNKNKDIYTITLTNGDTSDFEVTNGNSIESISYSRTVGLKDYYVITFSNGTTQEYAITNGKDGSDGVSLEDMYEEAKKTKDYNNISEFIEEYLTINIDANTTQVATGKAVLSAVSVYAQKTQPSWTYSEQFGKYVKAKGISAGAGVIYELDKESGDAYIITNCHVVYEESAQSYIDTVYCYIYGMEGNAPYGVLYNDEQTDYLYDEDKCVQMEFNQYAIPCTVLGASISYDIAVLKIEASEIISSSSARAINFSNSDDVVLGQTSIAVGNPNSDGISATVGVISVVSEYVQVTIDEDVTTILREFRTDAAVNPGNSGGGLFDTNGNLIGIVNAKTNSSSIENMGYAIPSNVVKNIADNIIFNSQNNNYQGVRRALLGVTLNAKSTKSIYDTEKLTTKIVDTIEVKSVEEGSVAENMGFVNGDIVKSVKLIRGDSETELELSRYYQLIDFLLTARAGDTVEIIVMTTSGEETYSHTYIENDFIEVK